ncbi:MAG: Holliday junction resolvase RuvX [Patescibacteria group bacterium]|nr:Holliday junction resolvase RuvX [Patescibacteria group bacterium]
MKFVGIDYGLKKIGIAVSEGNLAEPLMVMNVKDEDDAINKLTNLIKSFGNVNEIVIGISEGEMASRIRKFARRLQHGTSSKVKFRDETLSTYEAQKLSIESGKKQKKRRAMKDAYAAAIILQNYLDAQIK